MKKQSRKDRWNEAINKVREGLEALKDVHSEYVDWRDNLPENLECSPLGEKLNEVADAGFIDEIETACDDAENIELPLGFGRD
jgi:hypothetical protein